ncbi:hypothetical protein LY76DRAFT_688264 [Colletotrichum caudatum]|nr:hypothetical protein LY76DRAFT_688264 [Colletotrichum caudatum]
MLRCSYTFLSVGLAFINSCPVIASNDSRKAKCTSLFSEWMGSMIMIHNRSERKLTIVSMGDDPDEAMKDVFKSFKDTSSMVRYLRTSNPARFSYMDIGKTKTEPPITSEPTAEEVLLWKALNVSIIKNVNFDWYMYNPVALERNMDMDAVASVTKHLVDHEPQQLYAHFLIAIADFYSNMDTLGLDNFLTIAGVDEDESTNNNTYPGTNMDMTTQPRTGLVFVLDDVRINAVKHSPLLVTAANCSISPDLLSSTS